MKILSSLFIALSLVCPLNAHAVSIVLRGEQSLPVAVTAAIAAENEIRTTDVHPVPLGALSWKGGVIGGVVFEDSIPNCAIYSYQRGLLISAFAGAPCTFRGAPKMMDDRKGPVPDVVFELEVFLPNRGAMVNHVVAFYYDAQKGAFCESESLADWYQSGNRNLSPDLQDGRCAIGVNAVSG